jgi:dTDP-4-amino-4,6-dideoxygalactose transaminase
MSDPEEMPIDPADFTRFDPIPPEGIARADAIMRSGRLFRYAGDRPEDSEAALLERDFARYLGTRYALAVSSCTQAIELALIACGVGAGSQVLVPGFTFTAVPSAIVVLRATPVFVECNDDFRVDIDDLRRKMSPQTRVLLLSHMRGHVSDLDAITELCADRGITLIEDAAHALGGRWDGRQVGTFGRASCFSFQSNKIVNAGEGGVLATDDEEIIVKATYLSGAYETNYRKHFMSSTLFEQLAGQLPAHNVRMSNLTAAVARPQIGEIDEKGRRYRAMYAYLQRELTAIGGIEFPRELARETRIPDSIQFRLPGFGAAQMRAFVAHVRSRGLPLSGFADPGNARAFYNWRYLDTDMPDLPQTRRAIQNVCDMRLASTLGPAHLDYIVAAVRSAWQEADAMSRAAAVR